MIDTPKTLLEGGRVGLGGKKVKNTYAVSKSNDGTEWIEVGNVDGRSRGEAIATARRRDKTATERHWRTVLVACRSGRGLGRTKTVTVGEKNDRKI